MATHKQRTLTPEQQEQFMSILGRPFELTSAKIAKLFGKYKNTGTAFYQDDIITIGPNDSPYVSPNSITTVGVYIVNKMLFEDLKVIGYVNKPLNGKVLGKINGIIADALLDDDITIEQVYRFIDTGQWLFGGAMAHILSVSLSSTIITLPKSSKDMRKKLFEENKEALDAGDPMISSAVEKQICADALEHMRYSDDPSMALFDSGCGIDPYNNYKTMFIMKGAIIDNTGESPTGYKTVTSDFNTGISKDDMHKIADSLVTGAYAKGVATQGAGYAAKKYNSIHQRTALGPRGSDCKSTDTEEILMTEDAAKKYGKYRFIMEGGKPVMLTPKTVGKYIGKKVKLRHPGGCKYKAPCYCNVCFGDLAYRVDTTNVGLQFNIAQGVMLNAGMKKFHDVTIKTYQLDIEKDLLRFDIWK